MRECGRRLRKKLLCFSGKTTSVDFYYAFLTYRTLSTTHDIVKEIIAQPARLNVLIRAMLRWSGQTENCGKNRQRIYVKIFTSHVRETINQLDGLACNFV